MNKLDWKDLPDGCANRIWFVPEGGWGPAHYVFEYVGGPKDYQRLWIPRGEHFPRTAPGIVEWGWTLRADAVPLIDAVP